MKATPPLPISLRTWRAVMRTILILLAALCMDSAFSASVVVPPHPNPGQQVKVIPTVDVGFGRGLDLVGYIAQPGRGYAPNTFPRVQVVAGMGTNAQFFAKANYRGNIEYYGLDFGVIAGGSGYSDDVTVVVDPPHMNDFGAAIADSGIDEIVLEEGTYFQNALFTRDLTIRGRGKGRTLISGGLLASVFRFFAVSCGRKYQ